MRSLFALLVISVTSVVAAPSVEPATLSTRTVEAVETWLREREGRIIRHRRRQCS